MCPRMGINNSSENHMRKYILLKDGDNLENNSKNPENKVPWRKYLKDVFICSLGAYGGPEAHYGVFIDQLVVKRKYVTEEEMVELIALTGILPGPSSTQTIVAIGHKLGGPLLALLTMLVWALPVLTLMTLLSFLGQFLQKMDISQDSLRYIGPMAVGFIALAAYRIGRKVVRNKLTFLLLIMGAVSTYFVRTPWIFPLVLVAGGAITVYTSQETGLWNKVKIDPPWRYLALFSAFAIGGILVSLTWDNLLVQLFESFYRFGYLVIGGGQVVVPMMYSELVDVNGYMSNQEFLTGYGLVQGLPGPMFSFAAYAGGMAARQEGTLVQLLGAVISGIAIFLPGLLLIYFIYPVWEKLKNIKGIKVSLSGITAVAGGLISSAAIILMQRSGLQLDNMIVMIVTVLLLYLKKLPAPLIVAGVILVGFLF